MRFVAGRGADAEVFLAVGAVAKRHREADSGWSAAKRHREDAAGRGRRSGRDTAGRGADAEVFLAVGAVAKRHREADAGWSAVKSHREVKAKKKAGARCLTSRLCATELCCCGENEIRTRDTL